MRQKDASIKDAAQDKTARALRVYEYTDQNGVVYWSFTKLPFQATRRLNVVDVRGTHFRTVISDIQSVAFLLDDEDE